jgi:pimeloyl-ACP methyl ester carboxylesterase
MELFTVQFSVLGVSNVECFVGRGEELHAIHSQLQHDRTHKIVVMHSLGRMGKTQLALAYAQQHRNEYSAVF